MYTSDAVEYLEKLRDDMIKRGDSEEEIKKIEEEIAYVITEQEEKNK